MGRGHFDYERERGRDLMRVYRRVLEQEDYIELEDVVAKVINCGAQRFWVNEDIAIRHVRRMLKGEKLHLAFRCRLEMYEEILARTMEMMDAHPRMSIASAVRRVVRAPAPKFYLTVGTAREYIFQYRRHMKKERKRMGSE